MTGNKGTSRTRPGWGGNCALQQGSYELWGYIHSKQHINTCTYSAVIVAVWSRPTATNVPLTLTLPSFRRYVVYTVTRWAVPNSQSALGGGGSPASGAAVLLTDRCRAACSRPPQTLTHQSSLQPAPWSSPGRPLQKTFGCIADSHQRAWTQRAPTHASQPRRYD